MAGDILWSGYKAAEASRLTTELNSLANGSVTALSAEIDNGTNKYLYADVEVFLNTATPTGTPVVDLYLVPTVDGTNYPEFDTGASPSAINLNYLVATLYVKASNATHRAVARQIPVPPGKYKWALRNGTGVALNASSNTVKERNYNEAYS